MIYPHFALQLILNEKGFLGRRTFVLHQGEGPIRNIKWRSHFIAWANDLVSVLVIIIALMSLPGEVVLLILFKIRFFKF